MKKIILLFSTLALMLSPAIANAAGLAIGVSVSNNTLDTAGKEDVDSNGTIDATKNVSDDFAVGSIFAEFTNMGDRFGLWTEPTSIHSKLESRKPFTATTKGS